MSAASWLAIAGAALVLAAVVVVGLRRAHAKTDRAAIEAAMQRHPAGTYEASPFSRRPIPFTTEEVTPLDPADLPTVTNDDEALEAMIRGALAGEALPEQIEQRIKDAIEKERDK